MLVACASFGLLKQIPLITVHLVKVCAQGYAEDCNDGCNVTPAKGQTKDTVGDSNATPASPGQQLLEVKTPPGTCTKAGMSQKQDDSPAEPEPPAAAIQDPAHAVACADGAASGGKAASHGPQPALHTISGVGERILAQEAAMAGEGIAMCGDASGQYACLGRGNLRVDTPLKVAAVPAAVSCRDRPDSAPPSRV